MKPHLVTGGAGFIGANLVARLLEEGLPVRVLDNFATGRRDNLAPWGDAVELIEGDVRDAGAVARAAAGVEVVYHQAALGSVPRSIEDPATSNAVNVDGTLNVLLAAREAGARVVFASSSSIYGPTETLPKRETMPPNPVSPYAVSKYAAERYCQLYHAHYGLPTVCLRYFNVFGPRQDPDSPYAAVVPLFVSALLDGRAPTVFGDGTQSRDFTYIDNAVEANRLAARAPEAAWGQTFNVGCGARITLNDLYRAIAAEVGSAIEPDYAPPRAGDVAHSLAAIEQARERLGYRPEVDVAEGVRRTVAWYRQRAA